MTGTMFPLPKRLVAQGFGKEAVLVTGNGVYVTATYQGLEMEFPDEGDGSRESLDRILSVVRRNRRQYVIERLDQALERNETAYHAEIAAERAEERGSLPA